MSRALLAAASRALAVSAVFACACAPAAVPRCVRLELGSTGPESSFRITVPQEAAPVLADPKDRLDIAMSLVAPIDGPVTITLSDGGASRSWELKVPAPSGVSTRCSLGSLPLASTCGTPLGALPLNVSGQWTIDPGRNRLLEAGLALKICH